MQGIDQDIVTSMRHPLVRGAIALGALGLLVVAAMGGFREAKARQQPLPQVGPGQVAASDAFEVTPVCAYTTNQMPGRRLADADNRYLVLRVRVVNRMELDWSGALQKDLVWPADRSGSAAPAEWVLHAGDHSLFPQFPPRIPALVELVWPLPAGAAVPGRWGLYQRVHMRRHLDTGENAWLQQAPHALLVLPVGSACPQVAA